jgi:hypothetical protein
MKSGLRVGTAAIALAMGFATPALAQDEGASDSVPISIAPPPPAAQDAIGPAQLRDFSINGTVTRRAETPPTAAPQLAAESTATAPAQPTQPAGHTARSVATRTERPARAGLQPGTDARPGVTASSSAGFNFTPSAPATGQAASFTPDTLAQTATTPIVDTYSGTEANLFSLWPWLLALLAAGGAALWYFRRQRGGYAFAGAGGDASAFEFHSPQPAPRPAPPRAAPVPPPAARAPVPAPAPAPPTAPVGIVSTRLRPWLDIEFQPLASTIDGDKGTVEFEVVVYNSGSGPARDVLVEAAMFNAGPDQDQVIGQFFGRPAGPGDRIAVIPPLQRMDFRSTVQLNRDQLRIFEVEGRSLFVPLVGFNAHYRWSGGEWQTSASYLVGRNTDGEKMAPFLVSQGPKSFRGLGAREHTLRVRK